MGESITINISEILRESLHNLKLLLHLCEAPTPHQQPPCATMRRMPPLWALTMAPVWSTAVSPETTLLAPSSLPSLDVLATSQSWLAWATRMPTSVTRPSPREVSSP